MLSRPQIAKLRIKIAHGAFHAHQQAFGWRMIGKQVIANPSDPIFFADQRLIVLVGQPGCAKEQLAELGRQLLPVEYRHGPPLRAGLVRGGVRRECLRIDRNLHAAALQQSCGRQARLHLLRARRIPARPIRSQSASRGRTFPTTGSYRRRRARSCEPATSNPASPPGARNPTGRNGRKPTVVRVTRSGET